MSKERRELEVATYTMIKQVEDDEKISPHDKKILKEQINFLFEAGLKKIELKAKEKITMNKIFVFCFIQEPDWILGHAISEDGAGIASHVSSSTSFFRLDMGLTSQSKHDAYKDYYPEGYELIEISADDKSEDFVKARKLNVETEGHGLRKAKVKSE